MIPENAEELMEIEEVTIPSKDYRMNIETKSISGIAEDLLEMEQVIYKILNTERYEYLIYSWDYGIELEDLFGEPIYYVVPELKRRVIEALTQDDRIDDVNDFKVDINGDKVSLFFTVQTIFGDIEGEKEVMV